MSHTPTPWHIDKSYRGLQYIAGADQTIILADGSPVNKEYIVRACNSHPALVAACQAALHFLTQIASKDPSSWEAAVQDQLHDALAEAGEST